MALVAVQLWFASWSVVGKIALRGLTPRALIAARVPLAACGLLLLWWATGRERVRRADLLHIAGQAVFGVALNQLLYAEGLERTTATSAVVLGASIPVFTVAVALAWRKERATFGKLGGLAIAFAGALLVTGAARLATGSPRALTGNLLIVANSLCYSIYLVWSRDVLSRYRALTVVALTFTFGAVMVVPFGAASFLAAAPSLTRTTWLALAYIVVFASVGTYGLNAWALARVEASVVAIYVLLQPVVGALLATLVLDERPGLGVVAGGAAILAGVTWLNVDAARQRRARLSSTRGSR